MLKQDVVGRLQRFKDAWRRKVLWLDGVILAGVLIAFFALTIWGGYWQGASLSLPFRNLVMLNDYTFYGAIAVLLAIAGYVHFSIRGWAAKKISAKLLAEVNDSDLHSNYQRAFRKSARWWRSIFWPNPAGWGRRTAARLEQVLDDSNTYIEKLNDEYTNPSGRDKVEIASDRPQLEVSQKSDFTQVESGIPAQDITKPVASEN